MQFVSLSMLELVGQILTAVLPPVPRELTDVAAESEEDVNDTLEGSL